MIKRFKVTVPLPKGSEKRTAYVYLPDSYSHQKTKRYPVLYMFDGHNLFFDSDATFGKCWGLKEFMDKTRKQLIIAAVDCNHSPNHGRLQEYSPFDFTYADVGHITGRGKTTMDWFAKEFKPEIDRTYRTLSDRRHTFIAGSSMGGLMSLYALLQYNHVFSKAAALSPSLWIHPEKVTKMIQKAALLPDTALYMDYGSEEFSNHEGMKQVFAEAVSELMKQDISLTARIIPGGTHSEASWEKQIPFFMNTLLYRK
uniref:alpha/beta hydrolase n=1 Tax=Agathobacter sp. TaxID=2021311 RepID=UPI004057A396